MRRDCRPDRPSPPTAERKPAPMKQQERTTRSNRNTRFSACSGSIPPVCGRAAEGQISTGRYNVSTPRFLLVSGNAPGLSRGQTAHDGPKHINRGQRARTTTGSPDYEATAPRQTHTHRFVNHPAHHCGDRRFRHVALERAGSRPLRRPDAFLSPGCRGFVVVASPFQGIAASRLAGLAPGAATPALEAEARVDDTGRICRFSRRTRYPRVRRPPTVAALFRNRNPFCR